MTSLVTRDKMIREVCTMISTTRQKPDSKHFSKRELLHLMSYLRIQTNMMGDMQRRIQELEAKVKHLETT